MNSDCQFLLDGGANLVTAIATFLAVVVALFGEKIKAGLFPSKLKVSLRNPTGEMTKVSYEYINEEGKKVRNQEKARYYHLKVENNTKWPKSTQTQVFLQRVEQPGPDTRLQIIWDGDVPMEWQHQSLYPLARTIGPSANCDLCSIGEGKWLRIHPALTPNSLKVSYDSRCILVLTLQAKGNEGDSEQIRIRIAWDGLWEDGETEMLKHFIISDITKEI